MAEDWKALQAQITADLKNEGMEFTIRRLPEAKFDALAGQYIPITEQGQEFKAYGIFKSVGSGSLAGSGYTFAWQEGVTIQRGDKIVLLDCSTYAPELEDTFIFSDGAGEDMWKVKGISFVEPGGTKLLQYLLIRKA